MIMKLTKEQISYNKWYNQNKEKKKQQVTKNYLKNREYYLEYKKSYGLRQNHQLRDALFNILGRVCLDCGIIDERVLTFDHIHNDGMKDRRESKSNRTNYRKYRDNPELCKQRLQVLCFNCNWVKRLDVLQEKMMNKEDSLL